MVPGFFPNAKFVHSALRQTGALTQTDLVEETLLPLRTVQHALDTLQREDLIEERVDTNDALIEPAVRLGHDVDELRARREIG